MSQTELISPVLLLVQKLETAVTKWYHRADVKEDNKAELFRLKQQYVVAARILGRVKQVSSPDFVTLEMLRLYESLLKQDMDTLTTMTQSIERAKRMDRVRRMKEILDQCGATVKKFLEFATDKISPMLQCQSSQPQAQPLQQDVYTPFYAAPVNPPRLILAYNSNHTCEGKLKSAVLKTSDSRIVGVIASGKGGVGKTCALRGLACDKEVRERFPGGILYIELGMDAGIPSTVEAISTIVERTGGRNVSTDIEAAKSLQVAANKASVWFNSQSCLCLVDDIWRVNGIDRDVLTILGSVVNVNSRLVYTTRDTHFLSGADEVIEFMEKDPCGEMSRRMLMRHGGFSEDTQLDEKNKGAFEGILDICQGLPLAFGIAGGSVLEISRWKGEHNKEDAWSDFHYDMCSKPEKFFEGSAEQYGRLSKIVDVSLQVLERQHVYEEYSKWFRSFCVLEKQQSVPDHMLQKLWNMEELESARRAVRKFAEVSLVQVERKSSTGGYTLFVRLHDLVLDLAERKALEKSERKRIFQTLCRNYIPSGKRSDPEHEWWNLADDGYIHDNLCRILENAGYVDEIMRLLSKPQWIAKRLVESGIYSVEQDVRCGEAIADDRIHGHLNRREHLEQVRKAARRSYGAVANNPREVWFQLHGRLFLHATKSEITKRFVEEIEACAPRPWVKGSLGCLQPPGASVEVIESVGTVRCISDEKDEVWFCWEGESDSDFGVTCYKSATGVYKTKRLKLDDLGHVKCCSILRDRNSVVTTHERNLKVVIWNREMGQRKRIVVFENRLSRDEYFHSSIIELSSDGRGIALSSLRSGSCNHTVQAWDSLSGQALSAPLVGGNSDYIWCFAMSADGKRIVLGSWKTGSVLMFDACSGDLIVRWTVGHCRLIDCIAFSVDGKRIVTGWKKGTVRWRNAHSWNPVTPRLVGHTGGLKCVAVNVDDRCIVPGSRGDTVRVWDAHSGEAFTPPLIGHTGQITCVGMGVDSKRIVSGSTDKTVRVWDGHSGEALMPSPIGHTERTECVSVSLDNTRIVSWSRDKTVRVWDAHSGEALTPPFLAHASDVRFFVEIADGKRILSGSKNHSMYVWNAHGGELIVPPLIGHTSWIECVVVNADGTRIVSGSRDKTVRVWNVHNEGTLTRTLVGHAGGVRCVAASADGKHIVSGSLDRSVRVWEAESGDAVGMPLSHAGPVEKVGVDAKCSKIVSFDSFGTGRLWEVNGGECVLTSDDAGWYSTVDALILSWSSSLGSLTAPWSESWTDMQVRDSGEVLATCEEPVQKVGPGELYFTERFDKSCRIVR